MSSWIKARHCFSDRSALLVIGKRDAMQIEDLMQANQENPDALQAALSEFINRCRPELVGHVLWFIEFSAERKLWQMYVNHASLPRTPLYAEAKPQWLRLEDGMLYETDKWPMKTHDELTAVKPPLTAQEIGAMVDTTIRNYMANPPADEPMTFSLAK